MGIYRAELSHTTAFFRNLPQLEEFASRLVPYVWPHGAGDLRILCYGGSTGCEAFSLLIALREFGPNQQGGGVRSRILSVDMVDTVTEQGRQALYPQENFGPIWGLEGGHMPPTFRERWFKPEQDGAYWRVEPALQADAEFRTLNLLTEQIEEQFDCVVCQNVLTHLDPSVANPLLRRLLDRAKPRAALICAGVDLDLKPLIANAGFEPWLGRIDAIHDAFVTHRMHYREHPGRHYYELEDIDRTRADWAVRYSTLFYRA